MDIRGVWKLRNDIEEFLEKKGKDLLLARHIAEKRSSAVKIITSALAAVTIEAFLPGSAVYITGTQGVAIASLYYIYTGKILSPKTALAILPTFLAQTSGSSLFLFVQSFIPPTGILNAAAASIAFVITLALLTTVNYILSSGAELEEKELLQSKFKTYRKQAEAAMKELALTDVRDLDLSNLSAFVAKFLVN